VFSAACRHFTGKSHCLKAERKVSFKINQIATMSLAEKFEKISLDEVASIVAAVKKDGIEKSGLADNYEVLQARIGSKDEKEAVAACKAVVSLMEEAPESQVFVKECLGACKSLQCTENSFGLLCEVPGMPACQ
jgi:hypothetical protein